ncbi:TetR/AcrR family transcriptional regulator [Nonomuraea sp. bgisy101]|uniref:TetR/AcrR family transcriptional regulator n=1 Tax=Nonomuraea sp. bgisy101 TaxID=3413784 RepID=UPI003D75AF2B
MTEPDPRIAHTRDRVLRAALGLLAERGAGGLTIEAVAQRSGVAKSTIYRHWPGLPPLILDAFKSVDPVFPSRPVTGSVREETRLFLTALGDTITHAPWATLMATLVDAAERDADLRTLLADFIEQRRAPLRAIISDATERGQLPKDTDPGFLAGLLGGALFYRRLVSHEPIDDAFIDQLLDQCLPD